jgi:hypothetical protein
MQLSAVTTDSRPPMHKVDVDITVSSAAESQGLWLVDDYSSRR